MVQEWFRQGTLLSRVKSEMKGKNYKEEKLNKIPDYALWQNFVLILFGESFVNVVTWNKPR